MRKGVSDVLCTFKPSAKVIRSRAGNRKQGEVRKAGDCLRDFHEVDFNYDVEQNKKSYISGDNVHHTRFLHSLIQDCLKTY